MSRKGTITISGGKNSLIPKFLKIQKHWVYHKTTLEEMFSKVEEEAEEEEDTEEGEEAELPPRRPPRLDHDPLPDYPADLLIDWTLWILPSSFRCES